MTPRLRWAVVEADLDPVRGSEQRGRRPVLIVSNEDFNRATTNVSVLPLTSTARRLYPSEVRIPADQAGQPLESIVMAHQVRTISQTRIGRSLGYLEDESLQSAVLAAIRDHFDLD